MYPSTVFQLLPIYQYYSEKPERFLYSVNPNIKDGWKQGPVEFYGHAAAAANIVPIYRFVATSPYYRYQYSSQPTVNGPGWKNEGIAFYAADQKRRRNYVPVYQYYAVENGNWRYRYSLDGALSRGWIREKIAFYVPPSPVSCPPIVFDNRCGLL
ncbi:MAG: hypothetical protein HC827_08060 [Cyanobacteria bacterium RM1_2_2]|nr:hypothetical protein [Cyanobacteria bacterium RM1_2_2]